MRRYARAITRRLIGPRRSRQRATRLADAIRSTLPPIRVQVGAGGNALADWINTDVDGSVLYMDATARWPLADGQVDYIYGDNFIEHVPLDGARAFLAEARRVLRPGGRLRLVTPDVEANARTYLEGGAEQTRLLERHRRNSYRVEYPVDILWIAFAESDHWRGYLYDEASLSAELVRAGFHTIRRQRLGESDIPFLAGIDSRTEPGDELHQMAIEAW